MQDAEEHVEGRLAEIGRADESGGSQLRSGLDSDAGAQHFQPLQKEPILIVAAGQEA